MQQTSDKVRELAEKLAAIVPIQWGPDGPVLAREIEERLRAELKPLLDAADVILPLMSSYVGAQGSQRIDATELAEEIWHELTDSAERLAAELRNWRKE